MTLEQAGCEASIEADADKLKQILINLLDNAIKFSRVDSKVCLRAEAGQAGLRIVVEDHGAGVAAEDLPHLFERFFRGRSAHGTPGSGLGLAIARNLARLHGGDITVKSVPERGSTFTLNLPTSDAVA